MAEEQETKRPGIGRGLFWIWLAILLSQGVIQTFLLVERTGKPWRVGEYMSAGLVVLILIGMVGLIYSRRKYGDSWTEFAARRAEQKARRAEWDRRGRQL